MGEEDWGDFHWDWLPDWVVVGLGWPNLAHLGGWLNLNKSHPLRLFGLTRNHQMPHPLGLDVKVESLHLEARPFGIDKIYHNKVKMIWKATSSFLAGRVSSLETWLTKVPSLGTCLKIQLTVTAKDWIELSNWVTFLLDPEEATILLESIDCPLTLPVWLFHEVSTLRPFW